MVFNSITLRPFPPLHMSKIKHFIHKVSSTTGSKRNSLKSTTSGEAGDAPDHQNLVGFVETQGGPHPPNGASHHHHGRRRDRSLSLTEGKILRTEAREAAEEKEREKHNAERKRAYDEVSPSSPIFYVLLLNSTTLRTL